MVTKVNQEQARNIIEFRKPLGTFYIEEENGTFTGIDNIDGDSWCENFPNKHLCLQWLNRDIMIYHTESDFNKTTKEIEQQQEHEKDSYDIFVVEHLVRRIVIKADSEDEAIQIVEKMYDEEEIVLSFDD
ncbi:MAG TPA: DpnD/PcfM family protein, partial [Pseudogracilibacillus sp.]|nr:DpnD/PcfM family protein [Pseudogracilibacillus sp.]